MSNLSNGVKTMTGQGMIKSIDDRLKVWAEYEESAGGSCGFGGVSSSMIAKLMANGGELTRSTAGGDSVSDFVEETDRAVKVLADKQPALAAVIHEHYREQNTVAQKLEAMQCSRKTYYGRLGQAHLAIQMQLNVGRKTRSQAMLEVRRLRSSAVA